MTVLSSRSPKKKRICLEELGISGEQFEQYKQMFCRMRLRDKYIKVGRNSWITCHFQWQDRTILMHLMHEETIGLYPANRIDYLMFDIDNHDPERNPPVENRAREIISLLNSDPFVYTSSNSGGIRVCYFLKAEYSKETVLAFALRKLESVGVEIGSGQIEILAKGTGDRLPFCEGSHLVDPHTFDSLHGVDLSGAIQHAWQLYNGERLTIDGADTVSTAKRYNGNGFNEVVADLIDNGLPPDLTTNDALMKLNFELMGVRGMSAGEAERWMYSWIRKRHNGNSNRVNAGAIDDIDSQIGRIVEGFDRGKVRLCKSRPRKQWKHLTIGDVRRIVAQFGDYKTQLAAFLLLEYVKTAGTPHDTFDCIDKTIDRREYYNGNYNVLGFQQVWECEVSYSWMEHLDGFDRTHPVRTRKLLEDAGLINLHKLEDRSKHKCRTYLIFFTFDEESEEVVSLDEALIRLKTPKELKTDYSRYRSEKLIKETDKSKKM